MSNTPETRHDAQPRLWRLGEHRLLCGDATCEEDVALLLGSDTLDAIITDPPYGIAYVESKASLTGNAHVAIANDGLQSDAQYIGFTKAWLGLVLPRLRRQNSIYVFNADKMVFALREAMVQLGCYISQMLVWVKQQPVVGRLDYLPQHELVLYGWFGRHKFRRGKGKSVLTYPKPAASKLHPTMKPVALVRELVLNSTLLGETVYDPFGGAGSALMACEDTGRRCRMMEQSRVYCETIIRRWERHTGKRAEDITPYGHE